MRRNLWLGWLLSSLLAFSATAAPPRVLVSVKPLQLLVASLTQGELQPQLLLTPGSSPHDYAFRPSDMRKLQHAELILWVGEPLEGFLARPLQGLSETTAVIELMTLPGMPLRHHGEEDSEEAHRASGAHHHEHDVDPHLWLGIEQMRIAAPFIMARLSELRPEQAEHYQLQLQQFLQRLDTLRDELAARLQPLAGRGYFVFHDAYGYFEETVGIKPLGSFTINPQQRPGARTLSQIRQQLLQQDVQCVFAEPQFKPEILTRMVEGTGVRIATLDPLGSTLSVDAEGYFSLLTDLGQTIARCLER